MSLTEAPPHAPSRPGESPSPLRVRPLIAELLGPAGAGKTAVLRALHRDASIRAGIHVDRRRYLLQMMRNGITLAPTAPRLWRAGLRSGWTGLLHLIKLRTLPAVLERDARPDIRVVVLDEGPLFSLGRLDVFHHASQGDSRLARTWHAELDRWARIIDIVVWLDAPDPVLARRIRTRTKAHRVKADPDRVVFEFLDRYRQAYGEIRRRLETFDHLRVVDVDTGSQSVEVVARAVHAALARPLATHDPVMRQ